jgi:glycosyltransferase involved in cell wall biosynthesis
MGSQIFGANKKDFMQDKLTFTVVVPNYNHERFLKARIDSILCQTFQNFELIILDDCSTDESKNVIEKYRHLPNVRIFYNSKNTGSPFKQWKKGIKLAKGDYIWIAESDDLAEPLFLERMLTILQRGHGLAYCRSADIDENGHLKSNFFWADGIDSKRWKSNYINEGNDEIRDFLVYRCTIPNASACVFRKDLAPIKCGFDRMRYSGDWLFWINLLKKTSVGFDSETLNHFRHHETSTRNRKSDKQEKIKLKEILEIIERTRKEIGLLNFSESESEKYDWVYQGFYRKLMVPDSSKEKIIYYLDRYFPSVYPAYQKYFKK